MSELKGIVTDIQRFSLHDGPGIRTTIFLKGCPLACQWCHNPESIKATSEVFFNASLCIECFDCLGRCPAAALSNEQSKLKFDKSLCNGCGDCLDACPTGALFRVGHEMDVAEVVEKVVRDRPFYATSSGGVTISGGEPMRQTDFVAELVARLKAEKISVVLDTCGYVPHEAYLRVINGIEIFLFDIKCVDTEKHRRFTGKINDLIKQNYQKLLQTGSRVFVRLPLIPGFNDDIESISQLRDFISSFRLPEEIDILPFNVLTGAKYKSMGIKYVYSEDTVTAPDFIETTRRILTETGVKVVIYSK